MNGIKLGFSFADYAKTHGMGIGSVRLKDGSCIKVLNDIKRDIVEFHHIKNGYYLGGRGYKGDEGICEAAQFMCGLEKHAQNPADIDKAWKQSIDEIV